MQINEILKQSGSYSSSGYGSLQQENQAKIKELKASEVDIRKEIETLEKSIKTQSSIITS